MAICLASWQDVLTFVDGGRVGMEAKDVVINAENREKGFEK